MGTCANVQSRTLIAINAKPFQDISLSANRRRQAQSSCPQLSTSELLATLHQCQVYYQSRFFALKISYRNILL
jgi:hypothetical protein